MRSRIPTPEEIQKKLNEFAKSLKKEFGDGIQEIRFDLFPNPEHDKDGEKTSKDKQRTTPKIEFNLKPKEVKAYLDRYVIKQDEAKKTLAIAVCDHYNHVMECIRRIDEPGGSNASDDEYTKQNVLLMGPTGVGKTYLIKTLAKLIGVPFVKVDATKYSETGYVGGNVEDIIRDLVTEADGDVELAQYGMVFIDEIDKIASAANIIGKDVSGRGVQTGLLKLMEETEIDLNTPYDPVSQIRMLMEFQRKGKVEKRTINTKHILFFVSGAFNQLEEIIKQRLHKQGIGFGAEVVSKNVQTDFMKYCTSDDLIKFGFEPEFVGRLPVRVVCHELSVEDLFNILKYSEGSIIKQYKKAFKAYGINVTFLDESLWKIAEIAHKEKTGARALATICERVFRDYKFELPSTNIKDLVVTAKMVENPAEELKKLLEDGSENRRLVANEQLKEFIKDFFSKHEINIAFSDEAIDLLIERSESEGVDINTICRKILVDYGYGLGLIKRNTGKSDFTITKEVIEDPSGTLDRWIKQYYAGKSSETVSIN